MITAEKMDVDSNVNTTNGKVQKCESGMLTAKQVTASENFIFNEVMNKSKISIVDLNKFEKVSKKNGSAFGFGTTLTLMFYFGLTFIDTFFFPLAWYIYVGSISAGTVLLPEQ